MNLEVAARMLLALKPRERLVVYQGANGTKVTATQTAKFSEHDYAVGLDIPGRPEFYPAHVRLLFDLYLKRLSNESDARTLFCALERVCDGKDPTALAGDVATCNFPMQLDDAEVNLYYAQLLMIEQDFNFGPGGRKTSKLDPPREFLMRFIRWVASGEDEIDRIITVAVRKYPAPSRFATRLKRG